MSRVRRFIEAARHARAGRAVIVVTHRPAMLALANRVYRLEDGSLTGASAIGCDEYRYRATCCCSR